MHSEFDDQMKIVSSEITSLLNQKGFVFLVLTNDQLINNYVENKLLAEKSYVKKVLKSNLEIANQEAIGENNQTILIEVPQFNNEIKSYFSSVFSSEDRYSKEKCIYLIQEPIDPKFIEFIYNESALSSCIFISDSLHLFVPDVLNAILNKVLSKEEYSKYRDKILNLISSEKPSLSKLFLFLQSNKGELLKVFEKGNTDKRELGIPNFFLDSKGSSFLIQLTDRLPINSIEIFFRSFIHTDGNKAIPVKLDRDELQSISKLPKGQIDLLIETAKSETFNLLAESQFGYHLLIPEYLTEWLDLKRWIENEETSFKHIKQLEEQADSYFKGSGTLLSKDQIEQVVSLSNEIFEHYNWEEKYKIDNDLISGFILLSQKNLEEELKTQQKKRASLLKNSIRISIAVSIAFLFSSFTALLAYLERNSAVVQQMLAVEAKEEAEDARKVAEKERQEAISARENENLALQKAEAERLLALDAKALAEFQSQLALEAQERAVKSAIEASNAREIAEKNEKAANEAKIQAQLNFETSEKLRNQQEARASALEALGYFANNNYAEGTQLIKEAYAKNIANSGFPLQSDIFNGILNAINHPDAENRGFDLTHPAKYLSLSPNKDLIAIYTINGEIKIYSSPEKPVLKSSIKTGYIKGFYFLSASEIICQDINGKILAFDLNGMLLNTPLAILPQDNSKELIKVYGQSNLWLLKGKDGTPTFYEYAVKGGLIPVQSLGENVANSPKTLGSTVYWIEGKDLVRYNPLNKTQEILITAQSPITSISWSTIHQRWILGLEAGQLLSVDPKKEKTVESFTIHASKVSQLAIIPYTHNTELLVSTGFDGGLLFFVFDKKIPLSASISSRIKFQGHRSWITGFAIDEKNRITYSISNDKTMKAWSLKIENLFPNL